MVSADPGSIFGEIAVTREGVMSELGGFDLGALRRGEAVRVDADRLCFRREGVAVLSFARGEVDVLFSTAVREHADDVAGVAKELFRVAKSGGIQVHSIDTSDHARYLDRSVHPLAFLRSDARGARVGVAQPSNRLRMSEFVEVFARSGFEVVRNQVYESVPVT